MCLPIWRRPCVFTNVSVWQYCVLNGYFLAMRNLAFLTPLSLQVPLSFLKLPAWKYIRFLILQPSYTSGINENPYFICQRKFCPKLMILISTSTGESIIMWLVTGTFLSPDLLAITKYCFYFVVYVISVCSFSDL